MRLFLILSSMAATAAYVQPAEQVDVFRAGEGGYHSYRIPTIVTAADGSLIVFAEARKDNRGDPGYGDIDLALRRSTDRGKTWSPMQVLDDPGVKWAASNPTPVLDRNTKRLWVLFNRWEPGHGTVSSMPGVMNNQVWARWSDDHGRTWSAPKDLTRQAREVDNWGAVFLGPGGAIQTRTGRLIVPAAMKFGKSYAVTTSVSGADLPISVLRAYTLYSDDRGETWKRGEPVGAFTNENELVELADGAVMMDARQGNGDHRWQMISQDGGATFSQPAMGQRAGAIAAGIERFAPDMLLWTGPAGPGRRRLVARVSFDEGQTWEHAPERVIYGGPSAYSDLTMLDDGRAGVIWERGVSDGCQFVTFTTLSRPFLLGGGPAAR
ncbi:MAG: exo-alpha-sialidase [Acidobacteria bacterium]|nr:exo-alpha-sialidase [Acidobacteriota bacterium]